MDEMNTANVPESILDMLPDDAIIQRQNAE